MLDKREIYDFPGDCETFGPLLLGLIEDGSLTFETDADRPDVGCKFNVHQDEVA